MCTCTYCKIFRLGMNYRIAIQDSYGYTMNASSLDAGILSSTFRIANETLLQETASYIKSHEVIIVLSVLSTYPGLGTKRKSRKIEGNWQLCDFLSEVEFWSCLVFVPSSSRESFFPRSVRKKEKWCLWLGWVDMMIYREQLKRSLGLLWWNLQGAQ